MQDQSSVTFVKFDESEPLEVIPDENNDVFVFSNAIEATERGDKVKRFSQTGERPFYGVSLQVKDSELGSRSVHKMYRHCVYSDLPEGGILAHYTIPA